MGHLGGHFSVRLFKIFLGRSWTILPGFAVGGGGGGGKFSRPGGNIEG